MASSSSLVRTVDDIEQEIEAVDFEIGALKNKRARLVKEKNDLQQKAIQEQRDKLQSKNWESKGRYPF